MNKSKSHKHHYFPKIKTVRTKHSPEPLSKQFFGLTMQIAFDNSCLKKVIKKKVNCSALPNPMQTLTCLEKDPKKTNALNYKIFKLINQRMKRSDYFKHLYKQFLSRLRMEKINFVNDTSNRRQQENLEYGGDLFKEPGFDSKKNDNTYINFHCFQKLVSSNQLSIFRFLDSKTKPYREMRAVVKIKNVDWSDYKQRFFIDVKSVENPKDIRKMVKERYKQRKEYFNTGKFKLTSNFASKFKTRLMEKSTSRLYINNMFKMKKVIDKVNTEINEQKKLNKLKINIKKIIDSTKRLEGFYKEDTLENEYTSNERLMKGQQEILQGAFKANLIFYMIEQLTNKYTFIKLFNSLNVI